MDMSTPMSLKPLVNATCKLGEKGCFTDGRCHAIGNCEHKIVTNADRIRSLTDEALVKIFGRNSLCEHIQATGWCEYHNCTDCITDWLRQPVKEG